MDEYIYKAFMTALKISVKDKDLPMDLSVFKENHLNLCVPEGIKLDFNNSGFKKLGTFLRK